MKIKLITSIIMAILLISNTIFAESIAQQNESQNIKNSLTITTTQIPLDDTVAYKTETKTGYSNKEIEIDSKSQEVYNGHFVLYNAPILRGMSWFQPENYNSYSITITNNSSVPITITYGPENTKVIIDGNTTKIITDNDAKDNLTYKIDINNSDGSAIDGNISVRVSDQPL